MPSPGSSSLASEGLWEVFPNMTRHFPSFIIYKMAWIACEEKQTPLLFSKVIRCILKKTFDCTRFSEISLICFKC